ncbi:hypothetical protein ABZ135_28430 [Streptomyces sp. NPDC006339]|uniref:hypothetical protein n=1 Tax=Streptomyces sp. NPDC006339 TaxID=3156755 RepID=UPI0033A70766
MTGRPHTRLAPVRPASPRNSGTGPLLLAPRTNPVHPVRPFERPSLGWGRLPRPARPPEKPVAPRTPTPITSLLKPRLATALFRRYLRACIPTGPNQVSPLAGARPEGGLAETQRVHHQHH